MAEVVILSYRTKFGFLHLTSFGSKFPRETFWTLKMIYKRPRPKRPVNMVVNLLIYLQPFMVARCSLKYDTGNWRELNIRPRHGWSTFRCFCRNRCCNSAKSNPVAKRRPLGFAVSMAYPCWTLAEYFDVRFVQRFRKIRTRIKNRRSTSFDRSSRSSRKSSKILLFASRP